MNKHMANLKSIQDMANKIRKINLNESVNFEDDFEMERQEEPQEQEYAPEMEQHQEMEQEPKDAEEVGLEELDNAGELDKIRSITLAGMQKLYKQPESPEFQALYKIFQICNKGVEKEEKQG